MRRVMIVGGPGSGKSTLARKLGEITQLPVFHMDHIHWQSGWIERDSDTKSAMTHEVHNQDAWIFEGGHSRTYAERLQRADTFIWLDFPVGLRFWRVVKRMVLSYGRSRPDLPDGCPELFGRHTLEFWAFIWRTRKISRAKLLDIYKSPPSHLKTIRLENKKAVDRFLSDLECGTVDDCNLS